MKIRIKFSKSGAMRFIGHLDVMRYFQKLIRRANIPITYSNGLSPHQIMSFALPLGIGLESEAEYVDIEITEPILSEEAIKKMNEKTVEGIQILSFKELPDDSKNAMASVCAADYQVSFQTGNRPAFHLPTAFHELMEQKEILIQKKTKKSEREVDLKPYIYQCVPEEDCVFLSLSCGSITNIKPELVIEALFLQQNQVFDEYALRIKRTELYTEKNGNRLSLNEIGTDIITL